jgi:drug/metabolite transporter (DMT)-like permease
VSEPKRPLLSYLALAGLALIWGASFLFIKVAVQDMSPAALVLIRSASGFVALAAIVALMRRSLVRAGWRRRLLPYVVMAIGGGLIPWTGIAWGEERITSGLASILNATTPLFAAVLAYWVIPTERPSAVNYAGVFIGFGGVVILVLPTIVQTGVGGDTLGTLAVLVAAASYAVVALYQRRNLRGVDVYEASLGQLAMTVLIALPFAAPSLPSVHLNLLSIGSVLALGIAGSGVAYILYYYALNTLGPVRASAVTLLLPVTAVFWGVTLLHESVTLPIVVGMVVILAGIVLTNMRRRTAGREPVSESDTAAA